MTRAARFALVPLGLAVGLSVEVLFYDSSLGPGLTAADFAVGGLAIVCGVVAWERRAESRIGPLLTLVGFTWFAGNVVAAAAYLHRGPLGQAVLTYPTGRPAGRIVWGVVGALYLAAVIGPDAWSDRLTFVLAAAIAATAYLTFVRSSGPARRAGATGLTAAVAFAGVLALGAADRHWHWGHREVVLWGYDVVVASIVVLLASDLVRSRWADATVRGLVVDLGAISGGAGLRARLARALGDPSLVVGYRLPETSGFVDDDGRVLELPASGSGRTTTKLEHNGEEVGVLVHDAAVATDPRRVESVAAAAQLATANVRLQAEAREQAGTLKASRRRIVETTDTQRRRLEEQLRLGPERLLSRAAERLAGAAAGNGIADVDRLERELAEARQELRELAHGIRPAALTEAGLTAALELLRQRSPIPVDVHGAVGRLPASVEAALYFVCAEGLANAAKHAHPSRIVVDLAEENGIAVAVVSDDGIGGASMDDGSGLRGLADRVEALGGRLDLVSAPRSGTRLTARVPSRQL